MKEGYFLFDSRYSKIFLLSDLLLFHQCQCFLCNLFNHSQLYLRTFINVNIIFLSFDEQTHVLFHSRQKKTRFSIAVQILINAGQHQFISTLCTFCFYSLNTSTILTIKKFKTESSNLRGRVYVSNQNFGISKSFYDMVWIDSIMTGLIYALYISSLNSCSYGRIISKYLFLFKAWFLWVDQESIVQKRHSKSNVPHSVCAQVSHQIYFRLLPPFKH